MQQRHNVTQKVQEEFTIKTPKYRMYLLEARLQSGYSMNKLSKACGITRQHYSRIESGTCKARISFRVMGLIAKSLGLDLNKCFEAEMTYLREANPNDELSDY